MKFCLKKRQALVLFFAYVIPFFSIWGQETAPLAKEPPQENTPIENVASQENVLPVLSETPSAESSSTKELAENISNNNQAKRRLVKKPVKAKVSEVASAPIQQPARANVKVDPRIRWQLENAPEDNVFLYEPNFIPKINIEDDFVSPYLEKEIIVEKLSQKKSIKKYKPNLLHIVIIIFSVIIFIVYRWNISSRKRRHKIFKIKK